MAHDFTRMHLVWTAGEPTRVSTTHLDFFTGGAPTLADLVDASDAVLESARSGAITWPEIAASGYDLVRVTAQAMTIVVDMDPRYDPYHHRITPTTIERNSTGATVAGAVASSLPPGTCQIVKLLTATPGRSYKGRMYLPGGAELDASGAGIISAGDAAANAAFAAQLAAAAVPIWAAGVWEVVSVALDTGTAIVDTEGVRSLGSQRPRQAYVA